MELKDYQKKVISDLKRFLELLTEKQNISKAYNSLWEEKGVNFTRMFEDMINIDVKDYKKRVSKTHSFETNILKGFAANGGVKGM